MKYALFIFVLVCDASAILGQHAVRKSFGFLQVPSAARLSGLGGINVSLADRDINFVQFNPSLVSDSLAGVAAVNYQFYIAGINQSAVQYAHRFKGIGTLSFRIEHLSYGTIDSFDDVGAAIGEYKSHETAITVSSSHQISNFRLGASLKVAFSNLAGYRASAMLFDVGGVFVHPNKRFTMGLSVRNLGFMLTDYSPASSTRLPFDVQLGTTFKPENLPVRLSVTAYNLTNAGAHYDSLSGLVRPSAFDQVLRHFNFAGEILLHRNVNILIGYNHGIHQELKLENGGGIAGVSLGVSVRIKALEFTASRSTYTTGMAGYAFSLSQDVNRLLIRK